MEKGKKHDKGKAPMSLLDSMALCEIAQVMAHGSKKYGPHNWRGGIQISRLLDAALRHLFAFNKGEDFDSESHLSHLAHAGCCVMFLIWTYKNRPDLDDRYLPGLKKRSNKCANL